MTKGPVSGFTRAAGLAASLAALLAVQPASAKEAGVTVRGGWLRMIVHDRPAAGYFVLANDTATEALLTGASSPDCASLMLHRSQVESGQSVMTMVPRIGVPAHGTLSFAPGGYHLMCMQPAAAIHPGAHVPVTLRFADGGTLEARFVVRGATGQ